MTILDFLEITIAIGCPCKCKTFCAQDVLIKNYKGTKTLTLDKFKKYIKTVPKDLEICFSGMCEPFTNPQTIDMMEHCVKEGRPISLYTTLYGASTDIVKRLVKLPLLFVTLHIPDGKNLNIPITQEYKNNFFYVAQHMKQVKFMSMNKFFKTNNRENMAHNLVEKHKVSHCTRFRHPGFVLLPNGDLNLCCNDYKLNTVGNLNMKSYKNIEKTYLKRKTKGFEICKTCTDTIWRLSDKTLLNLAKDFKA